MGTVHLPPLETFKIINDPIHGYIPLTKIEYAIIQLPVFNRLHDLKQLSLAYLVFPGAVSTRFLHSIGAMHLGSKMIYQLFQTLEESEFSTLFPKAKTLAARLGIIQTVRLAVLLHDVGHGPFSHATEDIMRACLMEKYNSEFEQAKKLLAVEEPSHLPVHEYYSYMICKQEIKKIIENKKLHETNEGYVIPVLEEDIATLFVKAEKPREDFCTSDGLSILRKIVSSQLDADRMDYLVRDAYFTGVRYGLIDVDRIIKNSFIRKDKLGNYELAVHERAVASVEDMLDARFKMYKWLVSHHMVVALGELLRQAVISLVEDKKLKKDEFYWRSFCSGDVSDTLVMEKIKAEIITSGVIYKGLTDRRYLPTSLLKRPGDHKAFEAEICNHVGRELTKEMLRDKINKFFDRIEKDPKMQIEKFDINILAVRMPRSPYRPIDKEAVWIWSDKQRNLLELTKVSDYFSSLNAEWTKFPSFYFSWVGKEKTREELTSIRGKVREKIVTEIANS